MTEYLDGLLMTWPAWALILTVAVSILTLGKGADVLVEDASEEAARVLTRMVGDVEDAAALQIQRRIIASEDASVIARSR